MSDQTDPNYEFPPQTTLSNNEIAKYLLNPLVVKEDPNMPKNTKSFRYFTFRPPHAGPINELFVDKFKKAIGLISSLWFIRNGYWLACIEQTGEWGAEKGVHIHMVFTLSQVNSKALRDVKRCLVKAFPEYKEMDIKAPMLNAQTFSGFGLHTFKDKSLYCMGIKHEPSKEDKVIVDQQYFRPKYDILDFYTNQYDYFYGLLNNYLN